MKPCDNASVGVLIETSGAFWMGARATDPPGIAPPAGHVFDEHADYPAAAVAEVREELGLTVLALELVAGGWRPNACRRGAGPRGIGHQWQIFRATVQAGPLTVDPGSFLNVRPYTPGEIRALTDRTVAYARGESTAPGIEPVWVRWLVDAGVVKATDAELAAIEDIITGAPHAAAG